MHFFTIRKLRWLVAAASAAAALAFTATNASAASCSASSHCYGIAEWAPGGNPFDGADLVLWSKCMSVATPSTDFVDNEHWTVSAGGSYWEEAGLTYGDPYGANNDFFWAEMRPTYGYDEHNYASANWQPGTNYDSYIVFEGSHTWSLNVGPLYGTSSNARPGPAAEIEAGGETTYSNTIYYGSSAQMYWYNTAGRPQFDWSASGLGHATIYYNGTGDATWQVAYNHLITLFGSGSLCM